LPRGIEGQEVVDISQDWSARVGVQEAPADLITTRHRQPIQDTRTSRSTSARCLLAFIQLARRAMVISMLIRMAGGL